MAPARVYTGTWGRVYEFVERFMPWKYTGIYSHPEHKSAIPVVGVARAAPASPPFKPVTPSVPNEEVFQTQMYKHITKREVLLQPREMTASEIARMSTWQEETPLGGSRYRWARNKVYIYDYDDDSGYR